MILSFPISNEKGRRNQGRPQSPYHGARQNGPRPDAPVRGVGPGTASDVQEPKAQGGSFLRSKYLTLTRRSIVFMAVAYARSLLVRFLEAGLRIGRHTPPVTMALIYQGAIQSTRLAGGLNGGRCGDLGEGPDVLGRLRKARWYTDGDGRMI